jgi:GAF domain-containing protein
VSRKDSYLPAPDIGELLVQQGILELKDIELAIHYQNKQAAQGVNQSLEQILVRLGLVDRYTMDQLIAEGIQTNRVTASEDPAAIEKLIHAQTQQFEKRLKILQTAVEINAQLQTAQNLNEAIRESTRLVIQYNEIDYASIFLWEDETHSLTLSHSSTSNEVRVECSSLDIAAGSRLSLERGKNYHQVSIDDPLKTTSGVPCLFPDTKSEIRLPVLAGETFIGILDVQSKQANAFDNNLIYALQIISNFLGYLIHHYQSQETAKAILGELSMLYQANQGFAHSHTREQVFKHCYKTIRQLPQAVCLLCVERGSLQLVSAPESPYPAELSALLQPFSRLPLATLSDQFTFQEYLLLSETTVPLGMPEEYVETVRRLGYQSLTLIPIKDNQQLDALLVICSDDPNQPDQNGLQLCQSLASMASAALEKIASQSYTERQLNRLKILEDVSQVITAEIEMDKLFHTVHQQISNVMGDVDFLIALYDQVNSMIEIPYAYEEGQMISIPSFPLGDGLTSIIIRTRQPLLLVEDTEKRAEQLGARVHGAPAKSWLGVPLLVGRDVIGALIVQDLEKEHRFDLEDQHLLSMLATQVGIAVRNSRMIFDTTQRADRESIVTEITNKLWSSSGVDTILRTALGELGRALNADRGMISLETDYER